MNYKKLLSLISCVAFLTVNAQCGGPLPLNQTGADEDQQYTLLQISTADAAPLQSSDVELGSTSTFYRSSLIKAGLFAAQGLLLICALSSLALQATANDCTEQCPC